MKRSGCIIIIIIAIAFKILMLTYAGSPEPFSLTRSPEGRRYGPQTYLEFYNTYKRNSNGYNPIFSRSRDPTVLLSRTTGSRKTKMAAVKTETAIAFEQHIGLIQRCDFNFYTNIFAQV